MIVEEYRELVDFIRMFKEKKTDFMAIKGKPGTGKTYTVKEVIDVGGANMEGEALYVNSHLTPLQTYKEMYKHRGEPVIVDDIEALMGNKKLRSLFKQVGETSAVKWLQWRSTSPRIGDIPKQFETTSNLMIIANKLEGHGINKEALLDRGFVIKFEPKKEEILKKMKIISDKSDVKESDEVFDFVKDYYDRGENVNLRTMVKGLELKKWSDEWRSKTLRVMGLDKEKALIPELEEEYNTTKKAREKWMEITGKSRKTYFNYKKSLELT